MSFSVIFKHQEKTHKNGSSKHVKYSVKKPTFHQKMTKNRRSKNSFSEIKI